MCCSLKYSTTHTIIKKLSKKLGFLIIVCVANVLGDKRRYQSTICHSLLSWISITPFTHYVEKRYISSRDCFCRTDCCHKLNLQIVFRLLLCIYREQKKFYSNLLNPTALEKHPPKISCTGTIQINGQYVNTFDCRTVDYANCQPLRISAVVWIS